MQRLLLTVGRKTCPYRCVYCFTDFSQYERPATLEDAEQDASLLAGIDIVYPACDVDLFALKRWEEILERTAALGRSISLSTKAALDAEAASRIKSIGDSMAAHGALLKVAVSLATQSRCAELEPRAPTYAERLSSLERLAAAKVETALVLRPLLVDIAPAEYQSIIADVAPLVDCVLTGPEHLDDDLAHTRHQPRAPHTRPQAHTVAWAVNTPQWLSRRASPQEKAIRRTAQQFGLQVFDSDIELMAALIRRRRIGIPGLVMSTPAMLRR